MVSEEAIAEGRTLQGLGIAPTAFEAIVPSYLVRFRNTGQFDLKRNARLARPGAGPMLAPPIGTGLGRFARTAPAADRRTAIAPRSAQIGSAAIPEALVHVHHQRDAEDRREQVEDRHQHERREIAPAANTVPRFSTRIRAASSSDRKRPAASSKYSRPEQIGVGDEERADIHDRDEEQHQSHEIDQERQSGEAQPVEERPAERQGPPGGSAGKSTRSTTSATSSRK